MMFDPATTLASHVGGFTPPETVKLGAAVCAALLETVGEKGFHGGVRPDNICYDNGAVSLGEPYVHGRSEITPAVLEYIAPELFWSGQANPASDVYSIGLLLYAVLNGGRLPFLPADGEVVPDDRARAMKKRVKGEAVPPPADSRAPELVEIALRAVSMSAGERWEDVKALREALLACNVEYDSEPGVEPVAVIFGKSREEFTEMESLMAEIIASSAVAKPQTPTFAGAMPQMKTVLPSMPGEKTPESTLGADRPTPVEPRGKPSPPTANRPAERRPASEKVVEPPRRPVPPPGRTTERRPAPPTDRSAELRRAAPAGGDADDLDVVIFVPSGRRPSANPRRVEQPAAPPSDTPQLRRRAVPAPPPSRTPGPESYRRAQRNRIRTNLLLALVALAAVVVIIVFVFQNFGSQSTEPTTTPTGTVSALQPSFTPGSATPTPNSTPLPTPSLEPSPTLSPTPEVPDIKYEVYIENVSWQRAKERAAELGGHLVTITDAEEYAKVVEVLSGTGARYVWLGAQRGSDGAWTWENGESIDFFKWYAGEPSYIDTDGTPENCLMLWRGTSGAAPEWAYNDMRANPVGAYPQIFGGVTAFIVEYE